MLLMLLLRLSPILLLKYKHSMYAMELICGNIKNNKLASTQPTASARSVGCNSVAVVVQINSPKNLLCMKADIKEKLGDKLNGDHWKIFGLLWLETHTHTHTHTHAHISKTHCGQLTANLTIHVSCYMDTNTNSITVLTPSMSAAAWRVEYHTGLTHYF